MIFIDLNIGDEKGEDVLTQLRKMEIYSKTPAIAMSTSLTPKKQAELIGLGFSDIMDKELTQEHISQLLSKHL